MKATALPSPGIVATGPLTSDALAEAIRARLGIESLAFYNAIAPIVSGESIDATAEEATPLIKEADPELERLLAEEEEIERSTRDHHETPHFRPGDAD